MNEKTIDFQNRVINRMRKGLPIVENGRIFDIEGLTFSPPSNLNSIDAQIKMKHEGTESLRGWIKGRVVIKDQKTGKILSKSKNMVSIVPVYTVTDRGTYLVKGVEKTIISKMEVKPGIYTQRPSKSPSSVITEFRFNTKDNSAYVPKMDFIYNADNGKFEVLIKSKTNKSFNGVGFLRAIGCTDQEITRAIGNDRISDAIMMHGTKNESIGDIYYNITGKTSKETPERTKAALMEHLSKNATFGNPANISSLVGVNTSSINKPVLLASVKKMFSVVRAEVPEDSKDDLRFKEVLSDNDLLMDEFEKDFNVFQSEVRERLSKMKSDDVSYVEFNEVRNLGNSIDGFMTGKTARQANDVDLVRSSEQVNPLFMASIGHQISQALSSNQNRSALGERNLKGMGLNRLDPVETPESDGVGLVERLSQQAIVKDRTIYIPVLKVFGKEVANTKANTVELSPEQEYESKVAYFDSRYVKREGNKIQFLSDTIPARYRGQNTVLPVSEIQYIDTAAQNIFSYSANLIPYVNHDDGNRVLMGTNMQRDAMVLKNREKPLVSTSVNGTNTSYEQLIGEEYGRPVRATEEGIVFRITDTEIHIKNDDGKVKIYPYYRYFKVGQSHINNELKVKVGDRVKNNQIIAEGWQTVDGELSLGVNARAGYLSYKGQNYEDGTVISRSFANKMVTEEVNEYVIEIPKDAIGGIGSNAQSKMADKTTKSAILNRLDKDGIIKKGTYLKPGDTIAAYLKPKKSKAYNGFEDLLGMPGYEKGEHYLEALEIPATSYLEGKVERIDKIDNPDANTKQKIIITLVSEKPMILGDKMSGKHGNKGTVTKILPDDEMPVAADGKPLDVIFSPLAVPSRKNVGQLYEVGAGLIAEKKGQRILVNNFDLTEKDKVQAGLKEIGVPDGKMYVTLKEKLPNGKIVETVTENPVTIGNMYVMKLSKKSEDKIQSRGNISDKPPEEITHMPNKSVGEAAGEKNNPQSLGEMEMRALQAQGAVYNILESSTIKADGGGDRTTRMKIFNALKTGNYDDYLVDENGNPLSATPQSLKATADYIGGLGLKLQPLSHNKAVDSLDKPFDALSVVPMKGSEFIKMVGKDNEVTEPIPFNAKVDMNDKPIQGGVLDPNIFGERGTVEGRKKWGYVKLVTPVPNPLLFKSNSNPYSVLTGIKKGELEKLFNLYDAHVVIIDPDDYHGALRNGPMGEQRMEMYKKNMEKYNLKAGQIISAKELARTTGEDPNNGVLWQAGGEYLQSQLDKIDVGKELRATKKELDNAKDADVNLYYNKYKILQTLKRNDMEASDLMMKYVPVTPRYLRETTQIGDQTINSNLTTLYNKLIQTNNSAKNNIENGYDLVAEASGLGTVASTTSALYSKVSNIMGTDTYYDRRRKTEVTGIKDKLSGKTGIVRSKMLKKRVDFSGRAVIGVDPNLKLNEVGLPIDMAANIYEPFIMKELLDRGYASNFEEARAKLEQKDVHVRRVLDDIANDRPVIMNRQPTLQAQSVLAMKPVVKDTQDGDVVRTLQLNPLVVTAYNADFDGDQMAVHVPITEKAKEEAKKIMTPSENMISNANGELIFKIRQEMVMGIYYLTKDANKPIGKNKVYGSYSQLRDDYKLGAINTRQNVSIMNLKEVTAGYALFIMLLPAKPIGGHSYRSPIYHPIAKPWASGDLNRMFTELKDACEMSNGKAISKLEISNMMDQIKDLGFLASTKSGLSMGLNDFKQVADIEKLYNDEMKNIANNPNAKFLPANVAVSMAVEEAVEKKLKNNEAGLGDDNPVNIIMTSGARGNAAQYKKIMSTIGVGKDITGKFTDPVKASFIEGLSPEEYWTLSADSRKGIYDRSVATFKPGAFTREVWSTTQDVIITEKDCGTKDGIYIDKSGSKQLIGRTLLEDLVVKGNRVVGKKGQAVTGEMYEAIRHDDSIVNVKVRSPLKCKTVRGICQKCYGNAPGTMSPPPLGAAVGVIASQSFGEPFTQGTLDTFHTGGAKSGASSGLDRVKSILNLSASKDNAAIIAKVSGPITKIDRGMRGTFDTLYINSTAMKIMHRNGEPAKLKVDVGDVVTKGDVLTVGDIEDIKAANPDLTYVAPKDYFKLRSQEYGNEKAREDTQDLLLSSLSTAVADSFGNSRDKIDQRHMEVVISKMTGKVTITDPGDSNYLRGATLDRNEVLRWNSLYANPLSTAQTPIGDKQAIVNKISRAEYRTKNGVKIVGKDEIITGDMYNELVKNGILNVKVMSKPIQFNNLLMSKQTAADASDNFFSGMGVDDVGDHLSRGAVYGQIDRLNDPRGRLMTGKLLNVGEGYSVPRSIADSISARMKNLFAKD